MQSQVRSAQAWQDAGWRPINLFAWGYLAPIMPVFLRQHRGCFCSSLSSEETGSVEILTLVGLRRPGR
jgi:hypothetical protein